MHNFLIERNKITTFTNPKLNKLKLFAPGYSLYPPPVYLISKSDILLEVVLSVLMSSVDDNWSKLLCWEYLVWIVCQSASKRSELCANKYRTASNLTIPPPDITMLTQYSVRCYCICSGQPCVNIENINLLSLFPGENMRCFASRAFIISFQGIIRGNF